MLESDPDVFDVYALSGRYPRYFDLLNVTPKQDDSMDAIVVPTARSVEHIEATATLVKHTGSLLVALCSHGVTSAEMSDKLDAMSVPRWLAIDVPPGYAIPAVALSSAEAIPETGRRLIPSNLSQKRNAGVALSRMLGLQKILFVDDDIRISEQAYRNASLMLNGHKIAGLRCGGYPDKAVVDHAEVEIVRHHRSTTQDTLIQAGHISGNSVAVDVQESDIFFPDETYDEDLLAFYDMYCERSAALVDNYYYQDDFEPFADPDRARTEEFGETMTHGLYQHLRQGAAAELTDRHYWDQVIAHRRWLISYLLKGLDAPQKRQYFTVYREPTPFAPEKKERLRNSLAAALAANISFTGAMCVDYYRAWRADQNRWRQYLSDLKTNMPQRDAVHYLGLSCVASA